MATTLRPGAPALVFASSAQDAAERLAAAGASGAPLAGGTWIMRAGLRDEPHRDLYVSLARIAALHEIEVGAELQVGACVTHAQLAAALDGHPALAGLRDAAGRSANPAIRASATVGGALATADFPASDLVPALLALDAEVAVTRPGGSGRLGIEAYLDGRADAEPGTLVTAVHAPSPLRSAHARLTLRAAGDYPVAVVSVAEHAGGLRVALGSVEALPRRWRALEAVLTRDTSVGAARAAAEDLRDDLDPRDGVEAAGWYRARVLPALVGRAVGALRDGGG